MHTIVTSTIVVMAMMMVGPLSAYIFPFGWGQCPQPRVQREFDVSRYQGTWYEFQRFPLLYEAFVKCGQADYNLEGNFTFSVNNSGVMEIRADNHTLYRRRMSAMGMATIPDPKEPAKLRVSFRNPILSYLASGNYWILATNYTSFALVYSCTQLPFGLAYFEAAWIMTRERGVDPGNVDRLRRLLSDGGVDPNNFRSVDQTDCYQQ